MQGTWRDAAEVLSVKAGARPAWAEEGLRCGPHRSRADHAATRRSAETEEPQAGGGEDARTRTPPGGLGLGGRVLQPVARVGVGQGASEAKGQEPSVSGPRRSGDPGACAGRDAARQPASPRPRLGGRGPRPRRAGRGATSQTRHRGVDGGRSFMLNTNSDCKITPSTVIFRRVDGRGFLFANFGSRGAGSDQGVRGGDGGSDPLDCVSVTSQPHSGHRRL